MKRLQIMIEEKLDATLERQAIREVTPKVALIRRDVALERRPAPAIAEDPLWGLVGIVERHANGAASIDDVVSGAVTRDLRATETSRRPASLGSRCRSSPQ